MEEESKSCRIRNRAPWTEWSNCSVSYRSHTFSQRTRKCLNKQNNCPCRKDITQLRSCASNSALSRNAICHILLKNITSKDAAICADQNNLNRCRLNVTKVKMGLIMAPRMTPDYCDSNFPL